MSKIAEHCVNCKYWDCYSEDRVKNGLFAEGECHRYPPNVPTFDGYGEQDIDIDDLVALLVRGTPLMSHPFTYTEDWCGEFKCMDEPRLVDE